MSLTVSKIQVITPKFVIELDILNPNPTNLVEILFPCAVLIFQVKGGLNWRALSGFRFSRVVTTVFLQCRNCDYQQEADNSCIYVNKITHEVE